MRETQEKRAFVCLARFARGPRKKRDYSETCIKRTPSGNAVVSA